MSTVTITPAARRLAKQHNSVDVESGVIYLVDLSTGEILVAVATYAASQISINDDRYGRYALLRISHGRMRMVEAQRFIDEKGQGW